MLIGKTKLHDVFFSDIYFLLFFWKEFLSFLLDGLHEDLNRCVCVVSKYKLFLKRLCSIKKFPVSYSHRLSMCCVPGQS